MNVLITGATGFIGSRLALRCLDDGHAVRILGQNRNETERDNVALLERHGARTIVGSVTEADDVRRALEGIEVVFHLAAAQHEANVPDEHFRRVNVEGTRRMMEASVAAGVARFVHGSSIGVFGWRPGTHVDEDAPLTPDNIYGITKREGEEAVRAFGDAIPWVIVRISEVYGPGDFRLVKLFKGVHTGKFPIIGRGENLHHLVYIDDLVDALLASAELPAAVGQTFVLAGPEAVSTIDMVRAVARRLGRTPPRLRVPMAPVLALATVTESLLRPLGIQPPLHPRRMNFYRKSFRFRGDDARRILGYEPKVDLDEGVDRTASWYVEQGILPA